MKSIFRLTGIFALCLTLVLPALTSCSDDDYSTDQYCDGINLNSFGPSPVARGGQLRFLGSGLNQVVKITLPGSGDITDIEVISENEIRITVPQDAEPGYVVLHFANGTIQTKTLLTFTEPISIDEITPLRAKPGETVTIKGEYLNLIKEVCFSFTEGMDSVNVFAEDFITHSRKEISLVVPAEAVSGTIFISDAQEIPNMIESEVAMDIVLPVPAEVATLPTARPGQKITVTGTDFDLIKTVLTPAEEELVYLYTAGENGANDKIEFVLPDNMTDGPVAGVTASGVKVALVNIGVAIPTDLTVTPDKDVRPDQVVTIKGMNLDQVTSISVPNVADPVAPLTISNNELTFKYPAEGMTGNIVLNLKSGKTVELAIAPALPEATGYNPNPVSAGAEVTVMGHNLDLVEYVVFASLTSEQVKVTHVSPAEIKLTVPALAKSGTLTLYKANGEGKEAPELNVNAPECAYVVSVDTQDPAAGEIMAFTVGNGDKLTSVTVNGTPVQFIVNGSKLFINLPSSCGKNTAIKLISSNGEIAYTYDVIPATHVEKVIHEGMFNLGNWDAGGLRLYKEDLQGIPAGSKLVFHLTTSADAQIQLNDANWGQFAIVDIPAGSTKAEYELSAADLNQILTTDDGWSTTGIVVNGHTAIISKVTVEYEQSLETAIWEGSWSSGNWGGNQDLAWGGYDWSTVKAGSTLRLYVTPTVGDPASDWWCVAVRHGQDWGMLPAPVADQYGQPVSGVVEIALPQNVLDDLVANGGLVITGADYILTKVTIE